MSETKNPKPNRPPDLEEHGNGKAPESVQERAEGAYYAELFVDAMGEPVRRPWWRFWAARSLPASWWHLKLWEGP
jgi:hypothetical protein